MRRRVCLLAVVMAAVACSASSPGDLSGATADRTERQAAPESRAPTEPKREPQQVRGDRATRLVTDLVAAERAVRDPKTTGQALARAGHRQQRTYRRLVARPALASAVLAEVPRGLRPVVRANLRAGKALRRLATPQQRLPDWRIAAPAPAGELLGHYRRAEARHGVPWSYLAAIHLVETRMGRIRGTSPAGAQGPMQFMPATWAAYGRGDVDDDGDAIQAAARYLVDHGAPADLADALWHYNHSDHYVEAITAYAEQMRTDPRSFRGYYHWQVYYATPDGDVHLPVGYGR